MSDFYATTPIAHKISMDTIENQLVRLFNAMKSKMKIRDFTPISIKCDTYAYASTGNEIFAGMWTKNSGILRSRDGGESWEWVTTG